MRPPAGTLAPHMATRIPNIKRTFRNIKRAQEIVAVLVRFGFTDIVQELSIDRLVLQGKRLVGLDKPGEELVRQPHAVRLRQAAVELGPSFVKLAQILATRPDLIPEDWADEFAKLQSGVPAVPADEIRPHIEEMYRGALDEHFKSIDYESFAAASVGQAHHAVLHDGSEVILKVLRPGIRGVVEADIEIMRALAELAESRFEHMGYSPVEVVDQFERQVLREMDLSLEMRSMQRMQAEFTDQPLVVFPRAYPEHSNRGVLCMERIDGTLLSSPEAESLTPDERRAVVAIASDAVFRQCFEIGFFHADPHPGNIFVLRDSDRTTTETLAEQTGDTPTSLTTPPGVRVCFIDYGMIGHIDPHSAELLADLVHGTITCDLDRVVDVVVALTNMNPITAESRTFRADVWEFISRFKTGSLVELDMGTLLEEFFARLKQHRLRCPADIVYLIKAITTIEGVGEQVCPEFDLVGHVKPHIEGLVRRRFGFKAVRHRLQGAALAYAQMAESLPREAKAISKLIRHEQLIVRLKHQGLEKITDELERASRNISLALVIAALLVGGTILLLAQAVGGDPFSLLTTSAIISIASAVGISIYWMITRTWKK